MRVSDGFGLKNKKRQHAGSVRVTYVYRKCAKTQIYMVTFLLIVGGVFCGVLRLLNGGRQASA